MYAALQWVGRRAMFVAGLCYLLFTLLICFDIAARHLLASQMRPRTLWERSGMSGLMKSAMRRLR